MSAVDTPNRESVETPKWLFWVRALLTVAVLGAGYLAWVSIHNGPAAGCGPESGCNKVLQSRWAYWLDLPVSIPALLVYLALIGATVLLQKRPGLDDQRGSWAGLIVLSVVVAGSALWFVGLQGFVIKAFCKFCMTAHACGFAAALLCLKNIPWAQDPTTPMWSTGSGKPGVPPSGGVLLVCVGLIGVTTLVGGQLLFQKERNVVMVMKPGRGTGATGARSSALNATNYLAQAALAAKAAPQPVTPNPQKTASGFLSIYNQGFLLKLDEMPILGSPGASNIIVCLFDYTCPHCRLLHPILVATQQRLSNELGIVCLPMPISTNCNPFLPARVHSVSNACEYARLGLAVWRANPKAWLQFDHWFFSTEKPAGVEEARNYAVGLVGTNKLLAALDDPWVKQQILTDCRLHSTNWASTKSPEVPQLIMGDAVSAGPINSVQHLLVLLNRYLGMDVGLNRL
jgi:uncharacterized membrane protein